MQMRIAEKEEKESVIAFYQKVIAGTPHMEEYARWKWNLHPTEAQDDEVATVHLLGVDPAFQGKKIGKSMIEEIIKLAKSRGMVAVRLDALSCNLPAHKLYENMGFVYRGVQNLYASNTGWIDFFYYELVL